MAVTNAGPARLRAGLTNRQMNMIAVGGVIGAGLFVGSGGAIAKAGPAAVLVYAVVGLLVVLVMRMLAELAVQSPETGSFANYARRYLGPWAGLATGWCYAYTWAVIIGFEAVVGAGVLNRLVPAVEPWIAALVFMIVFTGSNLISVRSFGEVEFWFAAIKVVVIVAFLALGIAAIVGIVPGVKPPGTSNLLGNGGFAPHGWTAVALTGLVVVFSYFGTEIATIAAGESEEPRRAVRRALRSVVIRILIFYVGSIAIIVTLIPSTSGDVTTSPYVATLDFIGVPAAARIMDTVVLTAVLSCLNSGIYTCSRILFAIAQQGEAPSGFAKVNARGVPVIAVLVASVGGFLTVLANYFLPTATLFTFLLESTGAMAIVIYLVIATTQLRARAQATARGDVLEVRIWGYPYLTWAVIVVLLGISIALAFNEPTRRSFVLTVTVVAVAVIAGLIRQRVRGPAPQNTYGPGDSKPG